MNSPRDFKIGTIIRARGFFTSARSEANNGLWVVIGGHRNIMDMNSGHTMAAYDANRWISCVEVKGIRVKKLKPPTYEYLRGGGNYDTHLVDNQILSPDNPSIQWP